MLSPAFKFLASEREMCRVRVVMLLPKIISSGREALRKSAALADFLNASRPEEIIFGNNMTTLTLHISRSLARNLKAGDNILVTRLDHDANISPWMLIAEDKGCNLIWVDIDVEDGTLDVDDFARALEKKPKIAAFGYASNLLGTVNPVKKLTKMAKEAGALV